MITCIVALALGVSTVGYEQVRPLPPGETVYLRHHVVSPAELLVTSKAFAARTPTFRLYRVRLASPPTDEQLGDFEHDVTIVSDPLHEGEFGVVEKVLEGKYQLWRMEGGQLRKFATAPNEPASLSCIEGACVAATSQAVLWFGGETVKKLVGPAELRRTASLSPDGRFVAIADGTQSLVLVDVQKGTSRPLTQKPPMGCELQLSAWATVKGRLRLEARQPGIDPLNDASGMRAMGTTVCASKILAFDAATGALAETRSAPNTFVPFSLKPRPVELTDGWEIFTRDRAQLLGRRIPLDGGALGDVGSASGNERMTPTRATTVIEVIARDPQRADVERLVRSRKGQLQYCYERALAQKPDLDLTQRLAFSITTDGTTKDILSADAGTPDVSACLAGVAAAWRFALSLEKDLPVVLVLRFLHPP